MSEIRSEIISLLKRLRLYKLVRWLVKRSITAFWRLYGLITGREEKALESYFRLHDTRKLHLGCGLNYLPGWLNTDINPGRRRVRLNVTRPFPYANSTFDYIYSEHMIEHLPFKAGNTMLSECFRVLKPGGMLRLVTPDLKFLIKLYQETDKKIHQDYISWNAAAFIGEAAPHDALSVINNYVRDWGHQYIYDVTSLSGALKNQGFRDITERQISRSDDPNLQGLENENRHPAGFLALESLVLEARKPA